MAYGDFKKMQKVISAFGLEVKRYEIFLHKIKPIEPSASLKKTLLTAQRIGFSSEKERSERLVSPVLTELVEINDFQITLYSGHDLNVDAQKGLKGECDFLITWGQKALEVIEAPIFSVVEAKKEDMDYGTAQCIAQSIGVQRFNAMSGKNFPYTYGCATDGLQWRFFKLENQTVHLDTNTLTLTQLPEILGAFQYALNDCKQFLG